MTARLEIEFDGADTGVAKTPDFVRSMPVKKAMHPATLLALKMNGDAPQMHGFPARLIVPGWDGTSWVKWVTRITPQAQRQRRILHEPRVPHSANSASPRDAGATGRAGSDRRHAGEVVDHDS